MKILVRTSFLLYSLDRNDKMDVNMESCSMEQQGNEEGDDDEDNGTMPTPALTDKKCKHMGEGNCLSHNFFYVIETQVASIDNKPICD